MIRDKSVGPQVGKIKPPQQEARIFMVEATSDINEHMVLKHVSNQSGNKNDRKKPT
jgi:hypothetical protein